MTDAHIDDIHQFLKRIRSFNSSPSLQANELLSLSKPTPETMTRYKMPLDKNNLNFFVLIGGLIKNLFLLLSIAFRTFVKSPLYLKTSKISSRKIFISHFFGAASLTGTDKFFGIMPNIDRNDDLNFQFLYIDQIGGNLGFMNFDKGCATLSRRIYSSFHSINILVPLITKNLLMCIFLLYRLLKEANKFHRNLIGLAALSQLSVGTLRNQIFGCQIREIANNPFSFEIWLTLEGHAYERAIIDSLKSFNNVRIYCYQHAPVVPDQFGLFDIIEEFANKIVICTSGRVTMNFFNEKFRNVPLELNVVGSGKYSNNSNFFNFASDRTGVLFLAEGTDYSLKSMTSLALSVQSFLPSCRLIVRPHPNTPVESLRRNKSSLRGSNIDFSTDSLNADFGRSFCAVYRSSASIIEALGFGLMPIHFVDYDYQVNLDVLAISSLKYPSVRNAEELRSAVSQVLGPKIDNKFSKKSDFREFQKEYFTSLLSFS